MNSRKAMALALVLVFTGSAMAAGNTYMSHDADDVRVVQQHTVFVELVLEDDDVSGVDEIHEFGAVVGLVKECVEKGQGETFDNAVLWFNDQFLFGKKRSDDTRNVSDDDALGHQPPEREYDEKGQVDEGTVDQNWTWQGEDSDPGFLGADHLKERWGGCFIPTGFMHGIGHDNPYGTGSVSQLNGNATGAPSGSETVRHLIDLDNQCNGCIFEYEGTFYITDPNDVQWMVDKLVYPVALNGDLFSSGSGEKCFDGSGLLDQGDPRSPGVHADECRDEQNAGEEGEDNHRGGDESERGPADEPIAEPLYTVHVQVDPETGTGFADEAQWAYKDGTIREGAPYPTEEDANWDRCKNEEHLRDNARPCAIEYNFLLAMDFAAFKHAAGTGNYQKDNVSHGQGQGWDNHEGDSHPHNPSGPKDAEGDLKQPTDRGDPHQHSTVNVDLFFYERAPYFVETNPYWETDTDGEAVDGSPPTVDSECATATGDATPDQQDAITNRAVMVCDTTDDRGFHAHDGSQTM